MTVVTEMAETGGGTLAPERLLRFKMFNEIDPSPRKDWLAAKYLGAGELSCVFGPPGCGKSVIAGDFAAHVAAGREWHGRKVLPGAVLYVACERGALVERRFAAWRKHHALDDIPLGVAPVSLDLKTETDADAVIATARAISAQSGAPMVLIVIDTASRALSGGDENSPKDMGALVSHLDAIQRATGAHVMVIHHTPVDGQSRMRGHSALLGACDVTIAVERSGDARLATVDKTNDGDEGERVAFVIESVEIHRDEETGQVTTAALAVPVDAESAKPPGVSKLTATQQRALACLTRAVDDHGKPVPETFRLPGVVSGVGVDVWKDEMFAQGAIDRDGSNPRADFKRLKTALQNRNLIGERDGIVWRAA